jgi:hypothetical protein
MRRWRKMTWAIWAWTALMVVWAVSGASATDCGEELSEAARSACEAGTGIGVVLLFFVWLIGFGILSVIWFMTRPRERA